MLASSSALKRLFSVAEFSGCDWLDCSASDGPAVRALIRFSL